MFYGHQGVLPEHVAILEMYLAITKWDKIKSLSGLFVLDYNLLSPNFKNI